MSESEVAPDAEGGLTLQGRIMPASNATFFGDLDGLSVVYKPVRGERPLWDFPDGTLAGREVAAYLVSQAIGWDVVPRTWLGEGPHGVGMIQEWQEIDPDQEAVTVVRPDRVPPGYLTVFDGVDERDQDVTLVHEDTDALRRMAVFDVVTNNADRKGGHVLPMTSGHRYGVDHGLTFHQETKLRTVLWGWGGEPLLDEELEGLERLMTALSDGLADELLVHLTPVEVAVLGRRCRRLVERGVLPLPRTRGPAIPWPPF